MRNRVTNYLTKVSSNQIKTVVDRKMFIDNEMRCEAAMEELKKVYWHEKELLIVIPMLISNATTFELVETLTVHIQYIREHVKHLEREFPGIHLLTPPKSCPETSIVEPAVKIDARINLEKKASFSEKIMNIYNANALKNTVLR